MIRFGILGPGKISHRFVKGMKDVSGAKITAAASRDFNKAEEFCELYQIEKAYGSYEEMLKDKDVDAVYIATPPFVHKEQIMMCLKAGKHVLCEKPLMKTSKEARECFDLATASNGGDQRCFYSHLFKNQRIDGRGYNRKSILS